LPITKYNTVHTDTASLTLDTHFLATFWMVHCSRRMHESLSSGGAMSVVVDLSWPCRQLANSSTSIHIGTRLRHNACICFCRRAALSHWQTHHRSNLITLIASQTAAELLVQAPTHIVNRRTTYELQSHIRQANLPRGKLRISGVLASQYTFPLQN